MRQLFIAEHELSSKTSQNVKFLNRIKNYNLCDYRSVNEYPLL